VLKQRKNCVLNPVIVPEEFLALKNNRQKMRKGLKAQFEAK
jgi:hypothetical protein